MRSFFDFTKGDFIFGNDNGDSFMSTDGHLMSRMSDSSMLDLETGEMHLTSSNGYDDFNKSSCDNEDDNF